MIILNGIEVKPTIFPDKTQQVWKLKAINDIKEENPYFFVRWFFENESEIITIMQLGKLLSTYTKINNIELYINYLPYARQDKPVSNDTTFALSSFIDMINLYYKSVQVLDAHNPKALPSGWLNIIPDYRILEVIDDFSPTIICFPDKGASQRGYKTFGIKSIYLDKERNQDTGEITGLVYYGKEDLKGANVLIIDDLCDRGGTFILTKKVLDKLGVSSVGLYTTHGLYSGGTNLIFDSGIYKIYNYKEEVRYRT